MSACMSATAERSCYPKRHQTSDRRHSHSARCRLEYDPTDILVVIEPIVRGNAEVVYGSRYLGNPEQDGSALHRFGNKVLTGLSNLFSGQRLTDMETCYKAFRRELIQSISIEQNRFGFEPEITAKLAPPQSQHPGSSHSLQSAILGRRQKIGVKDLINTLWCIARYRLFVNSRTNQEMQIHEQLADPKR